MMSRPSSTARPTHHANESGTLFKNPWPSAEKPTWSELLTLQNPISWYSNHNLHKHPRAREIMVLTPDWGTSSLQRRGLKKEHCLIGTWLGHAATMVEIPLGGIQNAVTTGVSSQIPPKSMQTRPHKISGIWVLFDPIFSTRAGPTQYTGPGRMKPSPCQVADLPACHAVVISHNHYDHLDLLSIKSILKRFPKCKYFVPLGNKDWLFLTGVPKDMIYELDWWSNCEFMPRDFGFEEENTAEERIRFTCVPAQHNSGRATMDQGTTLWSGWVVEKFLGSKTPKSKTSTIQTKGRCAIYHAGDTGYRRTSNSTEVCPIFEEIGNRFGPIDLSFIPIWRGGTLGFVSYVGLRLSHHIIPSTLHASPADAIAIHRDVKSRNTIGVHFGTFIGSENESYEATIELDEAREANAVSTLDEESECENGRAGLLDIGDSVAIQVETI